MTEATIAEPSPRTRDRRVERSRRTIEFAIDALIRPGSWAAKIAYGLGLQGRVRSRTHRFDLGRLARDAVRPTLRVAFAADFHAGATTDDRLLADFLCPAIDVRRIDGRPRQAEPVDIGRRGLCRAAGLRRGLVEADLKALIAALK